MVIQHLRVTHLTISTPASMIWHSTAMAISTYYSLIQESIPTVESIGLIPIRVQLRWSPIEPQSSVKEISPFLQPADLPQSPNPPPTPVSLASPASHCSVTAGDANGNKLRETNCRRTPTVGARASAVFCCLHAADIATLPQDVANVRAAPRQCQALRNIKIEIDATPDIVNAMRRFFTQTIGAFCDHVFVIAMASVAISPTERCPRRLATAIRSRAVLTTTTCSIC